MKMFLIFQQYYWQPELFRFKSRIILHFIPHITISFEVFTNNLVKSKLPKCVSAEIAVSTLYPLQSILLPMGRDNDIIYELWLWLIISQVRGYFDEWATSQFVCPPVLKKPHYQQMPVFTDNHI